MRSEAPDKIYVPGLTQVEAQLRLKTEGANDLPAAGQRWLWRIALDVLRVPMFMLLISAGSIYLLLGNINDALILLGLVSLVVGITIYQENKTERVLEAATSPALVHW